MGKKSIKVDKNIYQISREELGLTRKEASELLEFISESRIEKIESGKSSVQPDEVLQMARVYRKPHLCNNFCSQECPIGKEYVPEVQIKSLPQIVLEMLNSLNKLDSDKKRLIEITSDGNITTDEIGDFVKIKKGLEEISLAVDSLNLWVDSMIASGKIDKDAIANETKEG